MSCSGLTAAIKFPFISIIALTVLKKFSLFVITHSPSKKSCLLISYSLHNYCKPIFTICQYTNLINRKILTYITANVIIALSSHKMRCELKCLLICYRRKNIPLSQKLCGISFCIRQSRVHKKLTHNHKNKFKFPLTKGDYSDII